MSDSSTPLPATVPPIEVPSIYRDLPLHVAAFKGDKFQLRKLISTTPSPSANDTVVNASICEVDGRTALHVAAREGNARCVRVLLKHKAKTEIRDKLGNTPLHLAASYNHRRSAELLLNAGAQVNPANNEGWRPLHNAVKAGFAMMVNLLLEKGADPDENTVGNPDTTPRHPLLIAAEFKLIDVARLLASKCKNLNPTDRAGRTPMHIAAANGSAEIVGALVMRGANVNIADNQGVVPLQIAIEHDYEDICHTLTTNGADVSLRYAAGKIRRQSDAEELDLVTHADRYGHIISSSPSRSNISSSDNMTTDEISVDNQQSSTELSEKDDHTKAERKKVKKEMERATKWGTMIKKWDMFSTKKSVKVISRAEKGIPDCVRGEAWKRLSNAQTQMELHKDKYTELCSRKSKWVTQIDLDVNRSSRNHLQFKERYGKGQVALFNVLKAYSVYDDEVGYCQGMSDITSLLLKYVTEEEAFWMLERLMYDPKWDMRELVLPGFPRLQAAFQIHDSLLHEYAPALFEHLKKENVVPAFYATKWYLMAFLDIFPFDITLRLWDVLLAEGYDLVFSIAINVLMMYQDQMLGKSFDKIMAFLRGLETRTDLDTDKLLATILRNKISSKKIKKVEAKLKNPTATAAEAKLKTPTATAEAKLKNPTPTAKKV